MKYMVTINGRQFEVEVEKLEPFIPLSKNDVLSGNVPNTAPISSAPAPKPQAAPAPAPKSAAPVTPKAPVAAGEGNVNSPMPGNIFKVNCTVGQSVKSGDVLIILEAMKMENEIVAPIDGVIESLHVKAGDVVETDTLLAVVR